MARRLGWVLAGLMGVAAMAPAVADACGGCFAPPETQQVVTDHRMVMAIHADESILWDQFRYTGRPQDFSWILPVRGEVRIELASGAFFDRLDALTALQLRPPPQPVCPRGGRDAVGALGFGSPAAESGGGNGVQVLNTAVVGPYQTVTIRADNPNALSTWLRENGYAVPPAVEPVLRYYNDMRTDFVALRLRPGEGVEAMQPIRVRFATPSPILPLRMVAAGIADKVGISLWVFGEGRWDTMNYPGMEIDRSAITWDFAANRSDYRQRFDALVRGSQGRAWVTEAAFPVDFVDPRNNSGFRGPSGAVSELGNIPETMDDYRTAVRGLSRPWVSRIRADLAASLLDRDLQLQASDRAEVSNFYAITRSTNAPVCPSDDGFYAGTDGTSSDRGISCAAAPGAGTGRSAGALALLALGLGAAIARRRRD